MSIKKITIGNQSDGIQYTIMNEGVVSTPKKIACCMGDITSRGVEISEEIFESMNANSQAGAGLITEKEISIIYDLNTMRPILVEKKPGSRKRGIEVRVISINNPGSKLISVNNRYCLVLDVLATESTLNMVVAFPKRESYMQILFDAGENINRIKISKANGTDGVKVSVRDFNKSHTETDPDYFIKNRIKLDDKYKGDYSNVTKLFIPKLPAARLLCTSEERLAEISSLDNIKGVSFDQLSPISKIEDGSENYFVTMVIAGEIPSPEEVKFMQEAKIAGFNFLNTENEILRK